MEDRVEESREDNNTDADSHRTDPGRSRSLSKESRHESVIEGLW
jgi:hypothetical protein